MSEDNAIELKIILVGEVGVGKTSIIHRFILNDFKLHIDSTTSVSSYTSKTIKFDKYNDKSFKYDIKDTAGQERFRSLTKIFFKGSDIAILVYDITNRNSFEELKNFWYKEVKDNMSEKADKFNFHII
jgi:small GTP-binding protein